MKSIKLVYVFFFVSGIAFGQSKKEIIESLNNRVDSLKSSILQERMSNLNLNKKIEELEIEVQSLKNEKSKLALQSDLDKINLNKQLKIRQDSLILLNIELLKYKPIPPKVKLSVKKDKKGSVKSVSIGTQVWTLENLNVSSFKNGVELLEVKDKESWLKAQENQQPAWCYYDMNPKNEAKYGKLYNWYAVIDNNGLCPQGWHIPSENEWDTLVSYLGSNGVKDKYDKDVRGIGLNSRIANKIGFNSQLGGFCRGGYFYHIGYNGYWWSSKEGYRGVAWRPNLIFSRRFVNDVYDKKDGFSVRCISDFKNNNF